ncbi:hypothetical protein FF1_046066 [Malus domestica]
MKMLLSHKWFQSGRITTEEKKLQAMEQIKLRNLQRLLSRKLTPGTSLVKFVKEVRSREKFLRSCYDEEIDHLSSDQFVKMMVVVGCFIIQLIREYRREDEDDDNVKSGRASENNGRTPTGKEMQKWKAWHYRRCDVVTTDQVGRKLEPFHAREFHSESKASCIMRA